MTVLVANDHDQAIAALLKPPQGPPEERVADVLLFVAVRSEQTELLRCALERGLTPTTFKGRESDYIDLGVVGRRRVLVVKTAEGALSYVGSAAKAIHCRAETQAGALISVGMAFGTIPQVQQPGDVLVSTAILAYDSAYVRSDETSSSAHEYRDVPRMSSNEALLDECKRTAAQPAWKGKVHIGLILSGGAKIHCAEYRDRLARKCAHGKGGLAVGGEMEGIGLAAASPSTEPNWIIIKGISDFADHDRHKVIGAHRPLACRNAAQFALETIARGPDDT